MKLSLKLTLISFLFLILLYYWYSQIRFNKIEIKDCTKNTEFYLDKKIAHPDLCEVYIKGEIDGTAVINGDTISPIYVNKLIYKGDWYDDPFLINYKNIDVKIGKLDVMYKFY